MGRQLLTDLIITNHTTTILVVNINNLLLNRVKIQLYLWGEATNVVKDYRKRGSMIKTQLLFVLSLI